MPDRTKHKAIIGALEAAGYQEITFNTSPTRYRFHNGVGSLELEFGREYFRTTSMDALMTRLQDKILPTLSQHPGKKLHIADRYIAVIALRSPDRVASRRRSARDQFSSEARKGSRS